MLLKRKNHKNIYVNQWLICKTENVQKTKFQIHSTPLKVILFKMMKTLLSWFNDFYHKGEIGEEWHSINPPLLGEGLEKSWNWLRRGAWVIFHRKGGWKTVWDIYLNNLDQQRGLNFYNQCVVHINLGWCLNKHPSNAVSRIHPILVLWGYHFMRRIFLLPISFVID